VDVPSGDFERVRILGFGGSVFVLLLVCGVFLTAFVVYNLLALAGRRPRSPEQAARGDTVFLPLYVREYWDWVVSPAVRLLVSVRASPDAVSFASLAVSVPAAVAFAQGWFGLGGWLYILAGTFDMLDGKVARATGRGSLAGAFLDSTLDRYTEILVLAGLAWHFSGTPVLWAALAALAGSLMVSYARARGEGLGYSSREGGMQRAERIVYLGLGGVFGKVWDALADRSVGATVLISAALVLIAITSNVSAVQRIVDVYRVLRSREPAAHPGRPVRAVPSGSRL